MTAPEPILIATEADGSGMGRFAVELANALEAAGHKVTMVARAQPYPLTITRQVIVPTAQEFLFSRDLMTKTGTHFLSSRSKIPAKYGDCLACPWVKCCNCS